MANTSDCFHSMIDLLIVLESIFVVLVGDILLISYFLIPLADFSFFPLSFIYEYILLLSPINSVTGIPAASSLNLPITISLVASKYGLSLA